MQQEQLMLPPGWAPGETWKAKKRREREGWFEQYAPPDQPGIDIGCQEDELNEKFRKWDYIFGDGDATFMEGVEDNTYTTVYASHVLEHIADPVTAIQNWYRITKPGGHLIILVPHRDLYEKKTVLPSNWNPEHKWFFLPDRSDPPYTLGLNYLISLALPGANVVSFRVLDEGYVEYPPNVHALGEYSIEAIIKKEPHEEPGD